MNNRALRADLVLLLVTLIWGLTFPLVTESVRYVSPYLFVSLRFGCAAVILFFLVLSKVKKTTPALLLSGLGLGVLNAGVYLLQSKGMQTVDADTAAFLAAAGIIFVPFISRCFGLAQVKTVEYFGVLLCLWGLYLLTGADLSRFHQGELLILAATLFWALSICFLQKVTPKIKQLDLLAFYQILFTLPVAVPLTLLTKQSASFPPLVIISILYTGILATALVFLLQVRFQKDTTATHAAIIYTLEPVLASFFAIYINHEALSWRVVSGGGVIILSIFLIEVLPRLKLLRLF